MTDELDLELEGDNSEEIISRKNKKINKLSEDFKVTNEKLAKEAEAKKKAEEERDNASKERDFYKGLGAITSKHPAASEYQDKIWEKVKSGYDLEDATVSILAKEGKYNPSQPKVDRESAAGGSAANVIAGGGTKSLDQMSREEKRAALVEAETKGEFKL